MEQNKLPKEIFNIKQENIEKLQKLFPSVIKDGQVDIKALKEELGDFKETEQEKYEMNWAGKQKAKQIAQTSPLGKTLKYVKGDGINEDTTENIYIEGDNLDVLKLLRKNYYGSIKMIYIDPPYNTGNDFVYKDNFGITQQQLETAQGQRTEDGEKLQKNTKEGNAKYHTNWLNMMYPRLKLAKDLLADDGVIFISIDDNEQANLKKLCDEIFGEENFITQFIWQKKSSGGQHAKNVLDFHEYILVYSKNIFRMQDFAVPRTEKQLSSFTLEDEYIKERGKFLLSPLKSWLDYRATLIYDIKCPDGSVLNTQWVCAKDTFEKLKKEGRILFKQNNQGGWAVYKKQYSAEEDGLVKPASIISEYGQTMHGKKEIKELFDGKDIISFPKPLKLIKHFIQMHLKEGIVIDFFSGSATTAHAVMQLNAEDGGNRKFIMVQLPELTYEVDKNGNEKPTKEGKVAYENGYKNICEIGKERIRRAGKKIQQENPDKKTDIGFKVFRVADTTLNWEKAALEGKDLYSDYNENNTEKDKLDFTPGFTDLDVVYEIMLRQEGLSLTSKIENLTDIGQRTFLVANSYLICLEENINEEIIKKLSELEPLPIKFVFRDSAFNDDIALKDESFRRLSALIDKNKGATKQVYTIEFI